MDELCNLTEIDTENIKKFSEKYQVKTIKELIDFYNKIVEHQEEFINLI